MSYLPLTPQDRKEMLESIGKKSVDELFSCFPGSCSFSDLTKVCSALSEPELLAFFKSRGAKNSYPDYLSFLGGGAYRHFIPEVVNFLSSKGEFVTPYTPYQPEVSQGSLQALFEYQTLISELTGLPVANSSLYDGGTAAAEGALLSLRKKSSRNRILVSRALHHEYREIIGTYLQNLGIAMEEVGIDDSGRTDQSDLRRKLTADVSCLIFQSPNYLGVIEDAAALTGLLHQNDAHSVQVVTEAFSLGTLKSPGACGVDICVGEAQSFGLPLSFGGPSLGFIAAQEEFLRQMPGRIVGETVDLDGKRGYVLTLSTREQHIKREKATSNICSNQAWCAIRAAIYLAVIGKEGLRRLSMLNHQNALHFVKLAEKIPVIAVKYRKNFFSEVVVEVKKGTAQELRQKLLAKKIIAGVTVREHYPEIGEALLLNFTELHSPEEIATLAGAMGESL